MTKAEYRKALAKLKLTHVGAAPVFGISTRQAQRIAAGHSPVPAPIAKLIRLLLAGRLSVQELSDIAP